MPGLTGEVANLIVSLKLDDRGFSGKLNTISRNLGKLDGGLSQMGRGVGQVGGGLARLGTIAATAAAGGLAAVVSTAVSFEDAFAGVRKTVDASDEELDNLMDTFRQMARTIPVSFEELARIGEQAGALGIATSAIDEFTQVVALLGETTDVTTEQAATSLGVLANVLHLREEDFDNFGSALVDLGNKGASTESQILAIAERAGAGASLIGVAADQTLGWASAAANLGIEVEAGGSALQKFFLETLNNIQDDDTLEVMAETAGVTADAFKTAFEKDASGALATFIKGLGELDDASRLNVLKNLGFDDIRIQRLLLGLSGDADMLAASLTIANEAWEDNTALQTEAAKRFETTRSKLDLLIGNLRDVGYVIGNEIIPIVADLSTEFVDFLNQPGTQKGIGEFARDLADGIRGFASEIKGTDFSGIIGGMKLAAEVAKGAFDAFRSLPAPIQQLAIAALVANKVSGGAVGDIAKGLGNILFGGAKLGGGLAGIFGGRGASAANPMYVAVTNQIPGSGGGPPLLGGKVPFLPKGLGGWLGFLGIAAADFVLISEAVATFERQKANVDVAANFEREVVEKRSEDATVTELQELRADLKRNLTADAGGGIINEALKGAFVNPELTKQIKQVDQDILAQTIHIQRGDDIVRGELLAIGAEDALTNRLIAEANLRKLGQAADAAAGSDRAMLNTAQQYVAEQRRNTEVARNIANAAQDTSARQRESNSYLSTVAAKNFSPTINLTNVTRVAISTTALQTQINRIRIAVNDEFRGSL